ncbi:S-adenosyl-L-methionine-dependent methyltransferase [Nemania sp. FL0916]|nr:S-adenosyl-L-methionine-dependent methyltransferase [Nemania sp. FL0916]
MPSYRSLPELGDLIRSRTHSINNAVKAAGEPLPSFDRDTAYKALPYTQELEGQRAELLEALDELRALALGPAEHVYTLTYRAPVTLATFDILYKYRIAEHLPLDGALSYKQLGARCGLAESDTRRYVQSAIALRVFEEGADGLVRHNAASAALANTILYDWIGYATWGLGAASVKAADALKRWPESEERGENAFALANGEEGGLDIFSIIANDASRVKSFGDAMTFCLGLPNMYHAHFVNNVPWDSTSRAVPKVVVDIGGSYGALLQALLRKYPQIEKAIVEDRPEVTDQGEKIKPADVANRLEFKAYDFFTEQPVKGADVYIMRMIMHDWSDKCAAQILRAQIPALKPGARILLNERVLIPPQPRNLIVARFDMACDIVMNTVFNSKERTREDWISLLNLADSRFKLKSIVTPPHASLSVIEIVWDEK